jgi:hypothetical protein
MGFVPAGSSIITGTILRMMKYPIHENLNTSFVNLAALVRYLRSLQFIGSIHIELSSYEADIEFTGSNTMRACEHDHIAGRIAHGEHALQRILIRAKEPGGLIHVFQNTPIEAQQKIFVDKSIVARANHMVSSVADTPARYFDNGNNGGSLTSLQEAPVLGRKSNAPLDDPKNWSELLSLISEILRTVDESLSRSNIHFPDAFRNACGFVSNEHPFLDPDSDVFSYLDGFISVRQRLATDDLTAGIIIALGRIMSRLREDAYFGNVYHLTMHRLRVLANRRRQQFEKYSITNKMQREMGI